MTKKNITINNIVFRCCKRSFFDKPKDVLITLTLKESIDYGIMELIDKISHFQVSDENESDTNYCFNEIDRILRKLSLIDENTTTELYEAKLK